MHPVGLFIAVFLVVLCFAGILLWALVFQPRAEKASAELAGADAWKSSGLAQFASQGFTLYQIVPAPRMAKAEFCFQDECGCQWGRYTGNSTKSATLEYDGKRADLYIQGGLLGGSKYAGKAGGRSENSIVIRSADHVIAETWRVRVLPAPCYRCVYSGDTLEIIRGGIWPRISGRITHDGIQVGAFRRPAVLSRNLFIAFHKSLPSELKACLCAVALLQ